jgi:glycosyltransferase involved in cell wall biosynthesis
VRLAGNALAERIKSALPDPSRLVLTANLPPAQLADLFRRAVAVVSPSTGDGTPNSVLEGMACGALPIVGDIEPLRDLLVDVAPDGLVDPMDNTALRLQIERTLRMDAKEWAEQSKAVRSLAIRDWSRSSAMPRVQAWYESLIRDGER